MRQVTLYISVIKTLEIVKELKQHGWVINKDFDFEYHKPTWDILDNEPPTRRYTIFTFYNDSDASYFMLRWA